MKKVAVVGSGFSSLSAACYLARAGYGVTVYEKNETIGGRARRLTGNGFSFDMGPTWYWMPDVYEKFFADFGKSTADYYQLTQLEPAYQIYFGKNDALLIPGNLDAIYETFENEEPGSRRFLKRFLETAAYNYNVAMKKVIEKQGKSFWELVMTETVVSAGQFVKSISRVIRKNIKNEKLAQALEFPVLFLGAKPSKTPAFYSIMNYADLVLGTWYPKGGFFSVVDGFRNLLEELGGKIQTGSTVEKILVENGKAVAIQVNGEKIPVDFVISGADYHHSEFLLEKRFRNYTPKYWEKKTFAPSAIMYFVGFNRKLKNLKHHTLFFDTGFDEHARKIYDTPGWPEKPLFYASFPSLTDPGCAPPGNEAAIILIPVAPGLQDNDAVKKKYFSQIMERMEEMTGQELAGSVIFKKTYGISDFESDYFAYKGNAYGLANTLMQTAFLKPKMQNRKIENLLYSGQLTVPGPGVPPSIISGKIAAKAALEKLNANG